MQRTILAVCLLSPAVVILSGGATSGGHATFRCNQCHVSHVAGDPAQRSMPLWNDENTRDGLPTFRLYSSPTFDALRTDLRQPDGASRLCLGCHDGSYSGFSPDRRGKVTFGANDLARSHPISFTYNSALAARVRSGALRDPAITSSGLGGTIAEDLLDGQSKLQCTSCHDVHSTGRGANHLRWDYDPDSAGGQAMCRVCHNR